MKLQEYFDNYIDRKVQVQFFKYIVSATVSYVAIFISIFILVEVLEINTRISFALVYAIAYVVMLYVYINKIFETKASKTMLLRYGLHLVSFYFLNNLLFYILLEFFGLNYIVAVTLNIGILFPLRFLSSKLFVFKA